MQQSYTTSQLQGNNNNNRFQATTVIPSNQTWLYNLNYWSTIVFLITHFIAIYGVFKFQDRKDWYFYAWSIVQLFLAVYSFLLTFGSVPLKLVILYGKVLVKIIIGFYVVLDMMMFALTVASAFINPVQRIEIFTTLLYQMGLNFPTFILMIPLWYFQSETEQYLKTYYPQLIAKSFKEFISDFDNGKIDNHGNIKLQQYQLMHQNQLFSAQTQNRNDTEINNQITVYIL
eukprot:403339082